MGGDRTTYRDDVGDVGDTRAVVANIEFDVNVKCGTRFVASLCQLFNSAQLVYAYPNFRVGIACRKLRELGLSARAVSHRAGRGRLHRIHRGVYAVGHSKLTGYRTQQSRERDARRDQLLRLAAFEPVRFTGRQVAREPGWVKACLSELIARRQPLASRADGDGSRRAGAQAA